MKKITVNLLLLIIVIIINSFQNAFADKSDRYYSYRIKTKPDSICSREFCIHSDSLVNEYPSLKKIIKNIFYIRSKTEELIKSIVFDPFIDKYLEAESIKLSDYVPQNIEDYNKFLNLKRNLNLVSTFLKESIKKDTNLVEIICYSFPDQLIYLTETFYFKDAFQPIEYFRGKQIRTYEHYSRDNCVLSYYNKAPNSINYFDTLSTNEGFYHFISYEIGLYTLEIYIPIVVSNIYISDMRFTYLIDGWLK